MIFVGGAPWTLAKSCLGGVKNAVDFDSNPVRGEALNSGRYYDLIFLLRLHLPAGLEKIAKQKRHHFHVARLGITEKIQVNSILGSANL